MATIQRALYQAPDSTEEDSIIVEQDSTLMRLADPKDKEFRNTFRAQGLSLLGTNLGREAK